MRTTQLNKIPDQYRDLHTEAGASEHIDELARLYLGVVQVPVPPGRRRARGVPDRPAARRDHGDDDAGFRYIDLIRENK